MAEEKMTKREQIQRAAYRCFRDHGYHATTIDKICKHAQVSKGSYYWHFESKQEVFIQILDTWSRQVVDELFAQFEEAGKADDYLQAISSALERESHRGRAIAPLWVEFTAVAARDEEIRQALSRFFRRIRSSLNELFRPILGSHLTDEELRAVSGAALAAYSGLIIQGMADPEADVSTALQRFMRALSLWDQAPKRTEKSTRNHPSGALHDRPAGPERTH